MWGFISWFISVLKGNYTSDTGSEEVCALICVKQSCHYVFISDVNITVCIYWLSSEAQLEKSDLISSLRIGFKQKICNDVLGTQSRIIPYWWESIQRDLLTVLHLTYTVTNDTKQLSWNLEKAHGYPTRTFSNTECCFCRLCVTALPTYYRICSALAETLG